MTPLIQIVSHWTPFRAEINQYDKTILEQLAEPFYKCLDSNFCLIGGLKLKTRITGSGLAATLVTPVTVCPLITGSPSPRWTGTMTRRPSAAPAPRPTEAAGGSIGRSVVTNWTVKYTLRLFPAWTGLLNQLKRASYWHNNISRDVAIREK